MITPNGERPLSGAFSVDLVDVNVEEEIKDGLFEAGGIRRRYGRGLGDPREGEEAALSAFDAQFRSGLFFDHDERTFNNLFFGGGTASLAQNTGDFTKVNDVYKKFFTPGLEPARAAYQVRDDSILIEA